MKNLFIHPDAALFLRAVRGVKTHHVVAAMNVLCSGTIVWTRCTKEVMAESYAQAKSGRHSDSASRITAGIDLDQLSRMARARASGAVDWRLF